MKMFVSFFLIHWIHIHVYEHSMWVLVSMHVHFSFKVNTVWFFCCINTCVYIAEITPLYKFNIERSSDRGVHCWSRFTLTIWLSNVQFCFVFYLLIQENALQLLKYGLPNCCFCGNCWFLSVFFFKLKLLVIYTKNWQVPHI